MQVCSVCGAQVEELVSYCPNCLSPTGARRQQHASFAKRLLAIPLDLVGMTIAWLAVLMLLAVLFGLEEGFRGASDAESDRLFEIWFDWAMVILLFVVPPLYYAAWEALPTQATPGRLLVRLRVTDTSGKRLGFARALWHGIARALTLLTLGIGYLPALFGERKQALHDLAAGVVVVER